VSGVKSRVLTLAAADPGEEGRAGSGGLYDVVVSNGGSTVATVPARLTVKAPPVFERQVSAQRVNEGDGAFFIAKVRGTPPLSYQWYKDGVAIEGGTSLSYGIGKVQAQTDAGVYKLVASNEFGQTVSGEGVLSVNVAVKVTRQPQSTSVRQGEPVVLSVEAVGTGVTYQWRRNGVSLGDAAMGAEWVLESARKEDGGVYDVLVRGIIDGEEKSREMSVGAVLVVNEPPVVEGFKDVGAQVGQRVVRLPWYSHYPNRIHLDNHSP
jgi:hypothetical protein